MLRGSSGPSVSSIHIASRGAAGFAVADLLRDHQRGGRGEDEAVDLRARRHRLLEEVERALHVHRHELRIVVRLDVRLVARRGMHDRLDAMVAHEMAHQRAIDHRAHDLGGRAGLGIEAHDLVAVAHEPRHQGLAEPARRTRHQDVHRRSLPPAMLCQHVVHDVGGAVVGDAVAPEEPGRLVVGEPGRPSRPARSASAAAGRWRASASPAWRACRRSDCRRTPRRSAAIPCRPSRRRAMVDAGEDRHARAAQ